MGLWIKRSQSLSHCCRYSCCECVSQLLLNGELNLNRLHLCSYTIFIPSEGEVFSCLQNHSVLESE